MRCWATCPDRDHYPSPDAEAAKYLQHRNSLDDRGYRSFLSILSTPLPARLPAAQRGLDFGCEPGPVLAHMPREAGHPVALYDPMFFPDDTVLQPGYDFITCSEVVEHLHEPARTFAQLFALVRPRACWRS